MSSEALEAATREGERWGDEIGAQNDFMTVTVEAPQGDLAILEHVINVANERSHKIGKLFMSYSARQLSLACIVPEGHAVSPKEWMEAVLRVIGGDLVECSATSAKAVCTIKDGAFNLNNGKQIGQGEGVSFEATAASVAWLRSKGLFPPAAADDDDDFIPEW